MCGSAAPLGFIQAAVNAARVLHEPAARRWHNSGRLSIKRVSLPWTSQSRKTDASRS